MHTYSGGFFQSCTQCTAGTYTPSSNGDNHATANAAGGDDIISLVGGSALIRYAEGDGNDTIYGLDNNATLHITQGDYTTTAEDEDVFITVADDTTIKIADGTGKTFYITDANGQTDTVTPTLPDTITLNRDNTAATLTPDFEGTFDAADYSKLKTVTAADNDNTLEILGNATANTLIGGKSHDVLDGKAGNDVLRGNAGDDTLNGGAGDDTLTGSTGNDVFIYTSGEGDDVITDYTSGTDTLQIIGGEIRQASLSGDDVILTIGTGTLTLRDIKGETVTITDENDDTYDTVWSDELTLIDTDATSIKLSDEYRSLDASQLTKPIKITGNSKANTIQGGTKADTISGGAGNDSILGNAGHDVLKGEAGADTLNGGKGNDTLTGGAGKDVFIITGGQGNDVITDYTSGEDKIKIGGGTLKSITTVSGSSKDVVFNFTSGKVTVKNAKGKEITYIDAKNKTQKVTIPSGTSDTIAVTLGNDDSSVYSAKKTVGEITAKKRTKAIRITGNSLNNSIYGSTKNDSIYGGSGADSINGGSGNDKLFGQAGNDTMLGGAGADTLEGGKGNDVLTGGAGKDVYIYTLGDGNDTITDYASGDQIRIKGTSFTKTNKNGNAVITMSGTGGGSITVLNTLAKSVSVSKQSSYEEHWFLDNAESAINAECGIRNSELDTILNTDSNVISADYDYDFNSTLTKQLNQALVTNTTKKTK